MAYNNVPKNKSSGSNSDFTLKVFDQYFQNPVELNPDEITVMTGYFESKGFGTDAAESIAITILIQAKKDKYSAMQIMDTLRSLDGVEISGLVAQILNYNRFKSSAIGQKQVQTDNSFIVRNGGFDSPAVADNIN